MLLRRLSSAQFAAWEMSMYLDTHPNDERAIASFKKYRDRAKVLADEYQKLYGPLMSRDAYGDSRWEWVNAPWPWENVKEVQ